MKISAIRISDDNPELSAGSGKTRAFFSQKYPAIVGVATINELVEYAANSGGDVRLCLHKDPSFRHHDMIIVQRSTTFFPPHRHMGKGETWNILRGEMAVFVFDDSGAVVDARRLTPMTEFLYRVGESQYHLIIALSHVAVYHECKPGPFEATRDSVFAPWVPDKNNIIATTDYRNSLLNLVL